MVAAPPIMASWRCRGMLTLFFELELEPSSCSIRSQSCCLRTLSSRRRRCCIIRLVPLWETAVGAAAAPASRTATAIQFFGVGLPLLLVVLPPLRAV